MGSSASLPRRTLNKIRLRERGHAYAMGQILESEAPACSSGEIPKKGLERVLPQIVIRVRHPGKHVFAFGFDEKIKRLMLVVNDGGQPPLRRPLLERGDAGLREAEAARCPGPPAATSLQVD